MSFLVLVMSCLVAGATLGVLGMAAFVAGSASGRKDGGALEREAFDREQAEHVQRFSVALDGDLISRSGRRVGTPNRAESPRSFLSAPNPPAPMRRAE